MVVGAVVVLEDDGPSPMGGAAPAIARSTLARATTATAVSRGDVEAVADTVADEPDLADEATEAAPGDEVEAPVRAGLAIVRFDATADTGYTISATADGAGVIASAVVPLDGGDVVTPADIVEATVDGPHLLLLAPEGDAPDEVTVAVRPIEVVSLDLSVDDPTEGEIAEPGQAVEYTVDTRAEQHYIVDLDNADLTLTVLAPDGNVVPTEPDQDLDLPRFVAEQEGTHRLRVSGGMGGATGGYAIEVSVVREFYFFYGQEGDDLYLPLTTDQFRPPIDQEGRRAHFCLFLREGVGLVLDVAVTDGDLDIGIDVFDRTDAGDLIARVNAHEAGGAEQWNGTATDADLVRCFQLWADNYSSGSFTVDFEVET